MTFKENCPDLRNTRVVDIIEELKEYDIQVDVLDPWVNAEEAEQEYDIIPVEPAETGVYDAIVLAVAHRQFKDMGGLYYLPPSISTSDRPSVSPSGTLTTLQITAAFNMATNLATAFNAVSTDAVYALFQQNLKARAPRQAVFEEMNLVEQLFPGKDRGSNTLDIFNQFSQSIAVKKSKKSDQTITLTVEGGDPVRIAAIANQLALEVERATTAVFISDIRAKVNASIKDVNRKMELLRELQQKLELANTGQQNQKASAQNNDGPFIAQIREKEYELAWLESIQIDPEAVKTASVDQAAYAPDSPIKPRRQLIIVLGLILGLVLGLFSAFFVNFVVNQKNKLAET